MNGDYYKQRVNPILSDKETLYYVHYYCPYCKEAKDCSGDDMIATCDECGTIVQYTENIPKEQKQYVSKRKRTE